MKRPNPKSVNPYDSKAYNRSKKGRLINFQDRAKKRRIELLKEFRALSDHLV